ncbi:lipopolysaccharide biosynthesis protein [Litchfieldella rifensis]|uniref:Lipopolysaccharide biosynthesis protein n=1 Tax=Litchfieldella rifensis TaxID=762643 RepID=A0ABV7LSQ8_9GAMM
MKHLNHICNQVLFNKQKVGFLLSLVNKTTIGVVWSFTEQLGRRGVGVLVTLLLAKFLTPEDFGLVAMMAVFLALGQSLMDSGFRQALIRLKNITQADFNTAFYANLVLGLLSYFILYLSAPLIAEFYEEPRLTDLIRVASFAIIIHAFQVVQIASLSRDLNFKAQLKTSLPSSIISGCVAVFMAYLGVGVWALVMQMVLASFLHTVLLWYVQGWKPTLTLSRKSLVGMYKFGYKIFLSGVLETIFKNIYVIVIAKIFSANIAGLYFFADRIRELIISQLIYSVQTVTYPALSRKQNDIESLKRGYRRVIQVTSFVYFPIVALLAALAEPIFLILLSEKWYDAHLYFQLLCLASVLSPLNSINLNILRVLGRSDILLGLQVFKKILLVIFLWAGLKYGVIGVLVAQIVQSVVAYYPNKYYSEKLIGYSFREQWEDIRLQLLISLTLGWAVLFSYTLLEIQPIISVLVFGMVFCFGYLIISYLLRSNVIDYLFEIYRKRKV